MTDSASTDGLCEHHTEHDDDCGYTEGTPETPCSHEHTDECYETVTECTHEHDEACGYQPAVEGTPCGYVCKFCESEDPEQKDGQEDEQEDERKTFTVAEVEAMIDALPDVEEVEALDPEEDAETLEEIYLQAADAADAFGTLSDEDQEKVSNLDKLMELHEWFNGGVATMDESGMIVSGKFANSESVADVFTWERYFIGNPVYKYIIKKTGTGTGNMPDWWSPESVPWYGNSGYQQNTKEVFIGEGVTSIGSCAFKDYPRLNSIRIPASVETIGSEAFARCGNSSDTGVHVTFGENSKLKKLELSAFAGTFLTSIEIPAGVTTIGGSAFQSCRSLSSITLPAGVKTIGNAAFWGCTSLTSIEIPAGVTTIGGGAFSYCTNLQTVTFKGTTPPANIASTAFSNCSITTIRVPAGSEAAYSKFTESLLPKQPSGSSGSSGSSSSRRHHSSSGSSAATANTAARTTSDSSTAKSSSPFTDVSEADWFYPDVAFVYACGLLGGTGDSSFEPYASVSRLSLAELFYRMEGCPAVAGRNNFTDVTYDPDAANDPDAAGAYDAVTWARQSGVLTGFGDGTFRPDSPITREQFAAAFYNYAKYKGYDVSDTGALDIYADGAAVSAWSLDAVNWAVGAGIINSRTDELFAPQAETMNAELAVMLHRFIEKYGLVPVPSPTGDGTVSWIKLPDAAA